MRHTAKIKYASWHELLQASRAAAAKAMPNEPDRSNGNAQTRIQALDIRNEYTKHGKPLEGQWEALKHVAIRGDQSDDTLDQAFITFMLGAASLAMILECDDKGAITNARREIDAFRIALGKVGGMN